MAKKKVASSCPTSKGCKGPVGWVVLLLGLLMLARDLGWNNWLGNLNPWTAVFLLVGVYWVWTSSAE